MINNTLVDNKEPSVTTTDQRFFQKKLTTNRRKNMIIKVLSFNFVNNHLSKLKKLYLNFLYKEAKYYTNYLIGLSQVKITDDFGNTIYPNSLYNIDTKDNLISVFNFLTKEYRNRLSIFLYQQPRSLVVHGEVIHHQHY